MRRNRLPWAAWPLLLALVALAACEIEETTAPEPVPVLTPYPASGSVDQPVPLDLAWSPDAVTAFDSFRVLADTVRPPRVAVFTGTDTTCTLDDLLSGRTYYWQVTGIDSTGSERTFGPWSFAVRPFLVDLAPQPEPLSRNLETDPVLAWTVAAATDTPRTYLAYVDTVYPPQHLAYAGPDSSFRMTGLEHDTDYWWRVTAVDAGDNTDTSGPWRFTTGPPAFRVELEPTPADSSADLDRVVTLAWAVTEATDPVVNWVVFCADEPAPTRLVHAGADSTVTLTDLRYGVTYWWTVTAFDAEGRTFDCGEWAFTLREFAVTVEPVPADGASGVATTGSLDWSPAEGGELVTDYLVYLGPAAGTMQPVYAGPATSLPVADLGLAGGVTYRWRVVALDADGYTCPLGPWSFTTAAP